MTISRSLVRMLRCPLGVLALLAAAAATPRAAHAHAEPYTFVDVTVSGDTLSGRLVAHVEDLARAVGASGMFALAASESVEARRGQLERALTERFDLEVGERRVSPRWGSWSYVPERQSIAFEWSALAGGSGPLKVRGPVFAEDPVHQTYVNIYERRAVVHQDVLTHDHPVTVHDVGRRRGWVDVARTFVVQGVHHIFIGPDHILFVIGLLLPGGGLRRLLKVVTAFTVAHSVTLALAALGLVTLSPRVVEPAIALSIVVVAIEALRIRGGGRDRRVAVAFGFGLVHGFGFASVLAEFGLPSQALGIALGAFNVGVELGQAAIVLAVAPLLALLHSRAPTVAPRVERWAAAGIAAGGAWWLVERLIGTT